MPKRKTDYYIPINSGFIEKKHLDILGTCPAILFELFVDWVTQDNEDGWGICRGGIPITYTEVEKRMSISRSTYTRYMKVLMDNEYIKTTKALNGIIIEVRKSKKWGRKSKIKHNPNESIMTQTNPIEPEMSQSIAPEMSHDCAKNDANDAPKMTQTYIKDEHTVEQTNNNNIYTPNPGIQLSEKINDYTIIKNLVCDFYDYQYQQFPKQLNEWDKNKDKLRNDSIKEIDKMIRLDGYTMDDIRKTLSFTVKDSFWCSQVISLRGLRTKKKNGNTKFTNAYTAMNRGKKDILDPVRQWLEDEKDKKYATG